MVVLNNGWGAPLNPEGGLFVFKGRTVIGNDFGDWEKLKEKEGNLYRGEGAIEGIIFRECESRMKAAHGFVGAAHGYCPRRGCILLEPMF